MITRKRKLFLVGLVLLSAIPLIVNFDFINFPLRGKLDAVQIARELSPYIVKIKTIKYDSEGNAVRQSTGSGVFISANEIVTNHHVVRGAHDAIYFERDKTINFLTIKNFDKESDLAILQSEKPIGNNIHTANLNEVNIGEKVFSISSPQNFSNTITEGIVSGIRTDTDSGLSLIQTTAAITNGSSGGALINEFGELIGITSSSYTPINSNINFINFAIPTNYILRLSRPKSYAKDQGASLSPLDNLPHDENLINIGWSAFVGEDGTVDESKAIESTLQGVKIYSTYNKTPYVLASISTGLNNLHVFYECSINQSLRNHSKARNIHGDGTDSFSTDNIIWDIFLRNINPYASDEDFYKRIKIQTPWHPVVSYLEGPLNKQLPKDTEASYEFLEYISKKDNDPHATQRLGFRYECDNNDYDIDMALSYYRLSFDQYRAWYDEDDESLMERIKRLELIKSGNFAK